MGRGSRKTEGGLGPGLGLSERRGRRRGGPAGRARSQSLVRPRAFPPPPSRGRRRPLSPDHTHLPAAVRRGPRCRLLHRPRLLPPGPQGPAFWAPGAARLPRPGPLRAESRPRARPPEPGGRCCYGGRGPGQLRRLGPHAGTDTPPRRSKSYPWRSSGSTSASLPPPPRRGHPRPQAGPPPPLPPPARRRKRRRRPRGAGGRRHCSWQRCSLVFRCRPRSRRRHHRPGRERRRCRCRRKAWAGGSVPLREPEPPGERGEGREEGVGRRGGEGESWDSLSLTLSFSFLKGAARDDGVGARARTGTSRTRARGGGAAAANGRGGRRGRFIFKFCLHSLSRALVPPSCLFHFPLPETAVAGAPAPRGAGTCG